jgi:hypothetical protein
MVETGCLVSIGEDLAIGLVAKLGSRLTMPIIGLCVEAKRKPAVASKDIAWRILGASLATMTHASSR